MATATLNRVAQSLRIDLTPVEFQVLDALIAVNGPGRIEATIAYLVRQMMQDRSELEKLRLKSYIDRARDVKRAELAAIMAADPQA